MMMTISQRDALQLFVDRLTSRSVLDNEEVTALLGMGGDIKRIPARKDFVRLGETVGHSCLVMDGLAGRFGQNGDGSRQITCLHVPGDMADLVSVVTPKAGWGLSALTPTTILHVPHAELRRVAASHPGIAEAFWRDSVADGSIFSEWVVNVGRRTALTRIAHVFCEMAVRCERAGLGDRQSLPLPITQEDFGDATGLTGVHVNRTLKELRDTSVVDFRAGKVTIHDWDLLVSTGDFDPTYLLLDGPAPRFIEPH
jgi:CRP-like cAMP-binding protein